ncbi:MAG: hypothetical protein Q4D38_09930 [Planctomycetia bacterium]|nr:hypothetical protein [Planctomycetia bacterium]
MNKTFLVLFVFLFLICFGSNVMSQETKHSGRDTCHNKPLEPKTFQELIDHWNRYSNETQLPFVYRIPQNPRALCRPQDAAFSAMKGAGGEPDSPFFCYNFNNRDGVLCIESTVVSSHRGTKEKMIEFLAQDSIGLRRNINVTMSRWTGYRRQPGVSRFFLSTKFNDTKIGNFSFDKRFGVFEGHRVCEVNFVRGNTVVSVFVPLPNEKTLSLKGISSTKALCDLDSPNAPDPCGVAWEIDQYLKTDPVEKLSEAEKTRLKTLEIVLPQDVEFVQRKEYSLDFPRKHPNGTTPAEIRLVVSRGEIQQISETLTLAPTLEGQYTILFNQSGRQAVRCYHLDNRSSPRVG